MRYFALLFLCTGMFAETLAAQWDAVAARSLVLARLHERERQPDNPFCEGPGCQATHEALGEYNLPFKPRKTTLIVAASTDAHHDCHSCGPALSFFEFALRGNQWELAGSFFGVAEWGQFGGAYGQGITVDILGDNLYGVFLAGGETHQGITVVHTRVLARFGKEFKDIAFIQTGEEDEGAANSGTNNWSAAVAVDSRPAPVHDLLVRASGVRDGRKFSETVRYRFNGAQYEAAP